MKTIPLTKGKVALVDDADYEDLARYKWYAMRANLGYYAVRNAGRINGRRATCCMHRQILGLEFGEKTQCDHVNGDKLDNRRENLRRCTQGQNQQNRGKVTGNKSGFKGVIFARDGLRRERWRAMIRHDGRRTSLGYFLTAGDAAHAYDEAAKKYHGEFACLNFPESA